MNVLFALVACIASLCCFQATAQTPAGNHHLIEFRRARTTPAAGYPLVKSVDDTSFYLAGAVLVSDDDVAGARTFTSALNELILDIHLTPDAAARLHEFTQRHIGERLAVLLDGALDGVPPVILDPASAGSAGIQVRVHLAPADAQRFAAEVAARWHHAP